MRRRLSKWPCLKKGTENNTKSNKTIDEKSSHHLGVWLWFAATIISRWLLLYLLLHSTGHNFVYWWEIIYQVEKPLPAPQQAFVIQLIRELPITLIWLVNALKKVKLQKQLLTCQSYQIQTLPQNNRQQKVATHRCGQQLKITNPFLAFHLWRN